MLTKQGVFIETLSYENCLKTWKRSSPLWNLDNLLDPSPILLDLTTEHRTAWTIFFGKKQFYWRSKYAYTKEKYFMK